MGSSYFPKQETLAHMSGEYGIPEFRTGDFHSTAGMEGSAKHRDEVEPKRDSLTHHPQNGVWNARLCQAQGMCVVQKELTL